MDGNLLSSQRATSEALQSAVTSARQELSEAQAERALIDGRIDQLTALIEHLEQGMADSGPSSNGASAGAGSRKTATAKTARKKTSARKTATAKKSSSKKTGTRKTTTAKKTSAKTASKKTAQRGPKAAGAGRAEAVVDILSKSSAPMRPVEVAEQLQASGRPDTASQTAAALSQLARNGRIDKAGDGLYQIPEAATPGEVPADA